MFSAKWSHLHAIHGLSDLVQVVGGAERLQADVCQLELLLPQFVLQLQDDFSLGFGALAQPAIRDYTQGGGRGSPRRLCQHTHTRSWVTNTHLEETGELKLRGKLVSVKVFCRGEYNTKVRGTGGGTELSFSFCRAFRRHVLLVVPKIVG